MDGILGFLISIGIIFAMWYFTKRGESDALVERFGDNNILSYFSEVISSIKSAYPKSKVLVSNKRFIQIGYKSDDGYVDFQISLFGNTANIKEVASKRNQSLHYEWNLRCPAGILLDDRLDFSNDLKILSGEKDDSFYDDNSIRKKYPTLIHKLAHDLTFYKIIGGEDNRILIESEEWKSNINLFRYELLFDEALTVNFYKKNPSGGYNKIWYCTFQKDSMMGQKQMFDIIHEGCYKYINPDR